MLGIAFGLGLGTVAGLSVGPQVFPRVLKPKDFSFLDEVADANDDVEVPEHGTKIGADMRRLLEYTEPWTTNPDFQRVSMINRMIKIMWPTLTKAIMDTVLAQVKIQLQKHVFENKKLGFIEEIVFGTHAMHPEGVKDFSPWVKDKEFTVGSIPPRVGGFKLYDTSEDEVIVEVPILFGSNMKMDIGVFIRFGPLRLYVPMQLSDVHFKADARITLKPLVDIIPCIGGATISLLQVPHVDCTLKVIGGVDLMALPILKDVIRQGLKSVLEGMMVQPNSMSFPLMHNYGLMPPPKGAINVKLLRGERLKDTEMYVELEVRPGRFQTSNTVSPMLGKAEFGEEFNLIVDDFEAQVLKVKLFKDDNGWNDALLGHGSLAFGELEQTLGTIHEEDGEQPTEKEFRLAEFIKVPMQEQLVEVKLRKPKGAPKGMMATGASAFTGAPGQALSGAKSMGKSLTRILSRKSSKSEPSAAAVADVVAAQAAAAEAKVNKDRGSLYLKIMFMPFFQPTYDDEEDVAPAAPEAAAMSSTASAPPGLSGPSVVAPTKSAKVLKKSAVSLPSVRQVTTKVPDKLKGVLTVTLIRCINLNGEDVNSYVRFLVSDDDQDQVQKSQTVFSQNSPRWGQKFDFVMVTAGSSLFMTVYGKRGLASNVLGAVNPFNIFKQKKADEEKDKVLGKLEIRVRDVVRNGTMKDIWTLQDAEKGQIELVLAWQTCYISDD